MFLPTVKLEVPSGFKHDKRKEGWELVEEGPSLQVGQKLDFVEFLEEGEPLVSGKVMLARVKMIEGGVPGQHQAEQMLDQKKKLPKEFKPYVLLFPGTQWREYVGYSASQLCFPGLCWYGRRWYLRFCWLLGDFARDCRVARFSVSSLGLLNL